MMKRKLETIESDIKEKEKQEKQETGFNTLNTLMQKELLRLTNLRGERWQQNLTKLR